MKGSQKQMKGPQQQMKGPQHQMNGVADLDQQKTMRLPAESTSHQAEVEELERREAPDVLLQKTVVEDNRYDGLDKVDRGKVGLHDVSKPTNRKDWNCPWNRRDGKGNKTILRPEEKQKAPVRTSHHHFYSAPGQLNGGNEPAMAPEELERMIQERMGLMNKEEEAAKQLKQEQSGSKQQQQKVHEERFDQNKMEVEFSRQQQQQQQHVQQQQHAQQQQHVQQQQRVQQEQHVRQQQQHVQQQVHFEDNVQNQENQQIKEPSADKIIEGLNQENQQSSEPSADEIIE